LPKVLVGPVDVEMDVFVSSPAVAPGLPVAAPLTSA
jgi:hypothetical protein